MTVIEDAKAQIEKTRATLRERIDADDGKGRPVFSSANGPIGINLIDALMVVIEDQQKRIEALEKRPSSKPGELASGR